MKTVAIAMMETSHTDKGVIHSAYKLKLTVSLGAFNQPTPPYFKEDVMEDPQTIVAALESIQTTLWWIALWLALMLFS